jgi:hypothetical protein
MSIKFLCDFDLHQIVGGTPVPITSQPGNSRGVPFVANLGPVSLGFRPSNVIGHDLPLPDDLFASALTYPRNPFKP